MWDTPETPFPAQTIEDIERIQSRQKKLAVERAKSSAFFAGKLDHIDVDRLDEADEWRKIPILTKEQLRTLAPDRFFEDFCIGAPADVGEYWRSGGATGRPLFYPRSGQDMRFGMEAFRRLWLAAGVGADDLFGVPVENTQCCFVAGFHGEVGVERHDPVGEAAQD